MGLVSRRRREEIMDRSHQGKVLSRRTTGQDFCFTGALGRARNRVKGSKNTSEEAVVGAQEDRGGWWLGPGHTDVVSGWIWGALWK